MVLISVTETNAWLPAFAKPLGSRFYVVIIAYGSRGRICKVGRSKARFSDCFSDLGLAASQAAMPQGRKKAGEETVGLKIFVTSL